MRNDDREEGELGISPPGRIRRAEQRGNPGPPVRLGEEHHPAVRADPSAIKRRGDFLALHGWKGERQQDIVSHGECGSLECWDGMASTPNSYAKSGAYAPCASPHPPPSCIR